MPNIKSAKKRMRSNAKKADVNTLITSSMKTAIKKFEKEFNPNVVSEQVIESLKELILDGAGGLKCPVCSSPLVTRIQKLYDLEDNLMLHPKAHCTKCSFQIHS